MLEKRYTPINYNTQNCNKIDLLVKVYKPNDQFVEGGLVSQFIDNLKINETVKFKYPFGKVIYLKNGEFLFK